MNWKCSGQAVTRASLSPTLYSTLNLGGLSHPAAEQTRAHPSPGACAAQASPTVPSWPVLEKTAIESHTSQRLKRNPSPP